MIFGVAAILGTATGGPCRPADARTLTLRLGAEPHVRRPRGLRGCASFGRDVLRWVPLLRREACAPSAGHVTAQFGQALLDLGNLRIGRALSR